MSIATGQHYVHNLYWNSIGISIVLIPTEI